VSVIGGASDLQNVLNAVHYGVRLMLRDYEGKPVTDAHALTLAIGERVKAELIQLGLFVKFDAPPDASSFKELAEQNRAEGGCGCAPGTILCPH
jgi:hypothetical protein